MPRKPRIHYPGAVYHVMARGVDGREVFLDDHDRRDFLQITARLKNEIGFSILAYCLMGNHFHFAIMVRSAPLSGIMHRLLTAYVLRFNSRHDREGHLFQARYKSVLCLDDRYLIALIRYIHMNPVRAGLTEKPLDWPWSSHHEYTENPRAPIADKELFFDTARNRNIDPGSLDEWPIPDDFNAWPNREQVPSMLRHERKADQPLDDIAAALFPNEIDELKSGSRRREIVPKKALLVGKGIEAGHSLVSIGAWLNCTPTSVLRLLRRNKVNKVKPDPTF